MQSTLTRLLECFQFILGQVLLMENLCHLPIDAHEQTVVTVLGGSVGKVNGILITLQGLGRFAQVAVGASQQVVGAQLLVGGAVAVVVVGHFKQDRVRGSVS